MTPDYSASASEGHDAAPVLHAVWQGRRWILALGAVGFALMAVYSLLLPPVYSARVTLLPQAESTNSDLLGQIATYTGAEVLSKGSYEQLYGEIIRSDRVLDQVLSRKWASAVHGDSVDVFTLLGIELEAGDAEALRAARERAKRKLRGEFIRTSRDRSTGFMVVEVSAEREPELAAGMANFLVDAMASYLGDLRGAKSRDHLRFVETQLADTVERLGEAEEELTAFLENNQEFASSPELSKRYRRLEREVSAQTSMWIELRRQRETARIDAHRDSGSIDVLDRARPPAQRSAPRRSVMALGGLLFGLVVGVVIVYVRAQLALASGQAVSSS